MTDVEMDPETDPDLRLQLIATSQVTETALLETITTPNLERLHQGIEKNGDGHPLRLLPTLIDMCQDKMWESHSYGPTPSTIPLQWRCK